VTRVGATRRATAVVVDDDPEWRELVAATLAKGAFGCVTASSYSEAVSVLSAGPADVAVVDIGLPGPSGLVLIDRLAAVAPTTAVVVLTGDSERDTAADAQARGADAYLIKPVQPAQLVLAIDAAIRKRQAAVATATLDPDDAIERLVRVAQVRDLETGRHSGRMSDLAGAIAVELDLPPAQVERIRRATVLHDIGKVGVPDEILNKPGPLTDVERIEVQRHARVGWQILSGSADPVMELAASIALAHHERWDGSGYPLGLAGEEIPLEARIAAVADVFEALTADRPYRAALGVDVACAELRRESGTLFDPAVVEAFFRSEVVHRLAGFGAEPLLLDEELYAPAALLARSARAQRASEGVNTRS
jgi:putative two-component system response regulator